jgi:hypothetical protein
LFLSKIKVNEPSASIRPVKAQGLKLEDNKIENFLMLNCLEGILV